MYPSADKQMMHDDLISGMSQHLTAGGALDRVSRARARAVALRHAQHSTRAESGINAQ